MYKNKLIDHIENKIQLTQNLTCILRVWRIYNPIVRFLKYIELFILLSKVVVLG